MHFIQIAHSCFSHYSCICTCHVAEKPPEPQYHSCMSFPAACCMASILVGRVRLDDDGMDGRLRRRGADRQSGREGALSTALMTNASESRKFGDTVGCAFAHRSRSVQCRAAGESCDAC